MDMRFLRVSVVIALTVVNLATCGVTLFLVFARNAPSIYEVDRTVYLDLSLSVLNVFIAVMAIVLAVSAFWGYAALREAAQLKAAEIADRVARQTVRAYVDKDGIFLMGQVLMDLAKKASASPDAEKADFDQGEAGLRLRPASRTRKPKREEPEL